MGQKLSVKRQRSVDETLQHGGGGGNKNVWGGVGYHKSYKPLNDAMGGDSSIRTEAMTLKQRI